MTAWQWLQSLFTKRRYIAYVVVLDPGERLPRDFPTSGTRIVGIRQT